MLILRIFLCYLIFLYNAIDAIGQDTSYVLPLVSISDQYTYPTLLSRPKIDISKIDLNTTSVQSLSELLSSNSNIYVRNYGPGTASTISLRGASAAQTSISWNDMPIMSPTLGLGDVSLINTMMFDNIEVNLGNHSASFGNGAVGGRINLVNSLLDTIKRQIKVGVGYGSFNTLKPSIRIDHGNKKWSSTFNASVIRSNNDFPILFAPGLAKIKQSNAEYQLINISQEVKYRPSANQLLRVHFWGTNSDRNIPPTLTQSFSKAAQQDRSLRFLVSYNYFENDWSSKFQLGFIDDKQSYQDSLIGLSTTNRFKQFYAKASGFKKLDKFFINVELQQLYILALTDNYEDNVHESRTSLVLNTSYTLDQFDLNLATRLIAVDGSMESPVTSASINYKMADKSNLGFTIGQVFRLPSLNDLHWRPGGNLELKPEDGYEMNLFLKSSSSFSRIEFDLLIDAYYRTIDNWILWTLAEQNFFFTASNLAKVETKGVDINLTITCPIRKGQIKLNSELSFLSSINKVALTVPKIEEGQSLFYTPGKRWHGKLSYSRFGMSVFSSIHWQGESLGINEDVDDFMTVDLGLVYRFTMDKREVNVHASFNNLANTNYFIIERRPMPGFNYNIGTTIIF